MSTDFRALCAELTATLAERINDKGDAGSYYVHAAHLLIRARAALAKADEPAVPQGREPAAVITEPSDEEWDALVERVWDKYETVGYQGERFMYDGDFGSALDLVRKELSRWVHHPAPVPVSERLPGPEDCDAEGRCWFGTPGCNVWGASWVLRKRSHQRNGITSWLTAHALPLPEVGE